MGMEAEQSFGFIGNILFEYPIEVIAVGSGYNIFSNETNVEFWTFESVGNYYNKTLNGYDLGVKGCDCVEGYSNGGEEGELKSKYDNNNGDDLLVFGEEVRLPLVLSVRHLQL